MLSIGLFIASLVVTTLTVFARLPFYDWWIRACDFPRLQIAAIALLILLLSPLAAPPLLWPTVILSAAVLGWQTYRILPYTRLWPKQVKDAQDGFEERCVSLLVANVLTPNRNAEGLTRQILQHKPDVVLTLESDQWWGDALDSALGEDYPYAVRIPLDNLYGMHLYSRLKLEDTDVSWLIQKDIPSVHTWLRLANGSRVRLHALHPRPPAPSESDESLWRDAELLLVGKGIHRDGDPTLVAGDLNDVAWSRTTRMFCRVSGMLDPRRGRGMFSTFHANYRLMRWPLDHIFVSEEFTLRNMSRLEAFGSDHFPILATFCFRPSRADEHENPEADEEDWEQAEDAIEEARSRDQDG
ncbi:endonuclease/exonuclease/phosphatase family protein [Marinobacter nanhaiticus D15-8W]|uniref:Endonuclease n=1 Tax=Marinobacter nanhaiticus D15-8W TaxID=626887 RepID=N6WZD8_9GAMM|nr:endonuclease [Marinobacter nanhaiticus D15-8W]BES72318.1 endonuclease/exonuclease/phosphatase family protein [Marinobacter nanhaiticus D15-8W]